MMPVLNGIKPMKSNPDIGTQTTTRLHPQAGAPVGLWRVGFVKRPRSKPWGLKSITVTGIHVLVRPRSVRTRCTSFSRLQSSQSGDDKVQKDRARAASDGPRRNLQPNE